MIIHLIVGFIKKTSYKMSQYFPKPFKPFGGDINITVDLSNYATKDDIKIVLMWILQDLHSKQIWLI